MYEGERLVRKRNLAIIYLVILTIGTLCSLYIPKSQPVEAKQGTVVIPDEAIRLRILANSDGAKDQEVKRLIRDEVNKQITEWVADLTSIEKARTVIQSNLDEIETIAKEVVKEQGVEQSVNVDFGQAAFPTKLYGQYLYPAGNYEAIIITLGEGEGANWWCVLFPPLCFLDFSNGTVVSESPFEEEEAEQTLSKTVALSDEDEEIYNGEEEVIEEKSFFGELFSKIF